MRWVLVKKLLPANLHPHVRSLKHCVIDLCSSLDRIVDRRTLSISEFGSFLEHTGLKSGATVLVHSSMDEIMRRVPSIDCTKMIKLLMDLVGSDGTIVMPSFPFHGLQYDYIRRERTFDPKYTPSRVGLLTEVFRRCHGVKRSLHPVSPFTAWGKCADEILNFHHLGTTCGKTSPMYRLQYFQGVVMTIGCHWRYLSLFHVPEELHPKTRELQYLSEPVVMTIHQGETKIPYKLHVLRPDRIRNTTRAGNILRSEGIIQVMSHKGLRVAIVNDVRVFIDRCLNLIDKNVFYSKEGYRT